MGGKVAPRRGEGKEEIGAFRCRRDGHDGRSMPKLECRRVVFYSEADEAGFFAALQSIRAIRQIEGIGDTIYLTVPGRLSEESLRGLIGVLHRYKVEMRQLAQFENASNTEWLRHPKAYWRAGIFGRG